jgi:hypothetical protein
LPVAQQHENAGFGGRCLRCGLHGARLGREHPMNESAL